MKYSVLRVECRVLVGKVLIDIVVSRAKVIDVGLRGRRTGQLDLVAGTETLVSTR